MRCLNGPNFLPLPKIIPGRRRTAACGRQRILDCKEDDWRATRDGIDALTLKQGSG
jgi:hypothetical protein